MKYDLWYLWVQVITESLPISSSGHVQLIQSYIDTCCAQASTAFTYFMHLPTVVIVILFFRHDYIPTLRYIYRTWPYILRIIGYGVIADTITVAWYLFLHLVPLQIPLWVGFAFTMMALLSLYWCRPFHYTSLTPIKAAMLGCVQGMALMGGISRFAVTYAAGCWLGLRPMRAFTWSFLLEWPLILAASIYGSFMLYAHLTEQLLHASIWLSMLGAGSIAYLMLYGIRYMIVHAYMWMWGIYMMVPLLIAWYKKI